MNKISIIIPTYNEKENILKLIKEIKNNLSSSYSNYEIIIIDDNSLDKTGLIAKNKFKKDKKIKVFIRKKDKGLAKSIYYGIKKSKGNIIVGMDADFNHPPKLIPKLIDNLKNHHLIIGSRFIKNGGMADKFRFVFTFIFNLFLKYFFQFPIFDNTSGFYAIKKSKLKLFPLKRIYQGYGEYHLRLVWYAKKLNLKIKEIPVYYQNRFYGQSKSNLFKMFFKYIFIVFKLKFNNL